MAAYGAAIRHFVDRLVADTALETIPEGIAALHAVEAVHYQDGQLNCPNPTLAR